jgi:phosphoribosylaminoimidazole-succinocarboxamide synthase
MGPWAVSGRFSVGDLKKLIPESEIKDKAEALTMSTGAFFEWLAQTHPDIPTCYVGVADRDGRLTTVGDLVARGDRTNIIVMKLAHVPESYCGGDLVKYRQAISSGELQCGVADVESIFRHGFPLGSSTFEKIFKAVYGDEDGQKRYDALATYDETVAALDQIRAIVAEKGMSSGLEKLLKKSHLDRIPNPGYVLRDIVYNTTSKFEAGGDRDLTPEEERRFSGLSDEGYALWAEKMFPELAKAQIAYCDERGIVNIDGKGECVAYRRMPVVADFCCTVDENRLMLEVEVDGVRWAIPSNKEIQRAIFRQEGVYAAINEAKRRATSGGNKDSWREYMPAVLQEKNIDLAAITEHSCNLMSNAIGEVANRMLGKPVFDAPPMESWVRGFLPYASKIERQQEASLCNM